jgi:hypothetical protein
MDHPIAFGPARKNSIFDRPAGSSSVVSGFVDPLKV